MAELPLQWALTWYAAMVPPSGERGHTLSPPLVARPTLAKLMLHFPSGLWSDLL